MLEAFLIRRVNRGARVAGRHRRSRRLAANSATEPRGYPERVHITGAARSGTTLMLALMLTCFKIDGGVARETRLWRAPLRGRRVVVTKQPDDEKLALFLSRFDPKLHVIYMLRDPREVVVSRHGTDPHRYWTNLRAWRQSLAAARPSFGNRRLTLVRYEALLRDPDGVQRALCEEMPFLKPVRPFSRFHEVAELQNSQWRAAMGSIRSLGVKEPAWRNHLSRLKGQLARHGDITDELIQLGYEQDNGWLEGLKHIEAAAEESRTPERESFRRRFDHGWRDFLGALAYIGQRIAFRL